MRWWWRIATRGYGISLTPTCASTTSSTLYVEGTDPAEFEAAETLIQNCSISRVRRLTFLKLQDLAAVASIAKKWGFAP